MFGTHAVRYELSEVLRILRGNLDLNRYTVKSGCGSNETATHGFLI